MHIQEEVGEKTLEHSGKTASKYSRAKEGGETVSGVTSRLPAEVLSLPGQLLVRGMLRAPCQYEDAELRQGLHLRAFCLEFFGAQEPEVFKFQNILPGEGKCLVQPRDNLSSLLCPYWGAINPIFTLCFFLFF